MTLTLTTPMAASPGMSPTRRPVGTRGWLGIGVGFVGLGTGVFLALGLSLDAAMLVTTTLLLQSIAGGIIAVWLTRRSLTVLEFVGLSIAVGSTLVVISGVVLGWAGVTAGLWGWLGLLIVLVVGWLFFRRRRGPAHDLSVMWDRRGALVAAGLGAVVGIAAVAVSARRYVLAGPWDRYHPDMPFFEVLGTSAVTFGPGSDALMVGDQIRYHWFSYVWPGQLTVGLDLEPFVALTRVIPVAVAIGLVALVAGLVGRTTRWWWTPALAVALITTGGFVGAAYGVVLNVDSPSTAVTSLWVLAFIAVAFDSRRGTVAGLPLGLVAGFVLSGAKVSAIAVLIASWSVIALLGLAWRADWLRTVVQQLVGLGVGAVAAFVIFVWGSSSSGDLQTFTWDYRASSVQGLDLSSVWWGTALGTVLLTLAIIPRAAGTIGLPRRSAGAALAVGLVVASVVPVWILSQGVNELWFAVAAAAPLAVLSAMGLERLWAATEVTQSLKRWLWIATAAGVVSALLVALLWSRGASDAVTLRALGPLLPWIAACVVAGVVWMRGARPLLLPVLATVLIVNAAVGRGVTVAGDVGLESSTGPNVSVSSPVGTKDPDAPGTTDVTEAFADLEPPPASEDMRVGSIEWSVERNQAAVWLRDNALNGDILATNQVEQAMIPAVVRLRTYLSGLPYQAMYGSRSMAGEVPVRDAYSRSFTVGLTPESVSALCSAGVDWLWVEGASTGISAPVVFANERVTVYRLTDSECVQ